MLDGEIRYLGYKLTLQPMAQLARYRETDDGLVPFGDKSKDSTKYHPRMRKYTPQKPNTM